MPTYTLTTDLIADCMALIPQNLERLNADNQQGEVDIWFEKGNYVQLVGWDIPLLNDDNLMNYEFEIAGLPSQLQFLVLSHCLRTIPEFQAENKERFNYQERIQKNNNLIELLEDKNKWAKVHKVHNEGLEMVLMLTPKTIASATLHGQGEFPPSTLEELCESYKQVMSK